MNDAVTIGALTLLAVVVVVFFMRKRIRHVGVDLSKGTVEADAAAPRGVSIKGAVSREGSVLALDGTGQGAAIENVDAKRDVIARATDAGHDPKA